MTVVTALAVSWNPLMNSNRNATARAKMNKSSGPIVRAEAASQKVITSLLARGEGRL